MPATPHTIARRYRVLEEAGRGGMGSVWRCVDERLGREVAVKQVGRLPGESVTHRARALREARSSAALNHPHVVSIYDAVAEEDQVWLVMEYVSGRTLAEIIRDEGPVEPRRAAAIGAQVADGLAAAHARGTVHRDVKPGNVLVEHDDRAKISDFGIARTTGDATLTQTGMIAGTPAYLAPEIARGGEATPASDVWALGATLFAAVEGRPPYDSNLNALALLNTIATEDPAEPQRAGALTQPLHRMLDRDPASRWSMTDVAHALHRVLDPPAPTADTSEATQALAAPMPVTPVDPPPAPVADSVPSTAPRRRRRLVPALLGAALVALLLAAGGAFVLLGDDSGSSPDAGTTNDAPPSDDQTSDDAEPSPSDTTEPTPAPSGDTEPAATGAGDPGAFVVDYYAALPDDTRTGYSLLSPSYRADLSFGEYDGFWSTVDDVEVLDTVAAGPRAVDVTLLYNGDEQEVRRIFLEGGEDGWLITGDEVVG